MSTRTFYDILNAQPNASCDQLKENYKQLILRYHPDKLPDNTTSTATAEVENMIDSTNKTVAVAVAVTTDPHATSNDDFKFVDINKAWNTLKDPAQRKLYDAELIATRFQKHSNIFARLKLADLNVDRCLLDDDDDCWQQFYTYNCRCGGQYVVDDSDALHQYGSEMLVECSECSLKIIVSDISGK